MRRNNKGFTLVELLVVISVIGILSSILLPVTAIARRKVRELATKGEIYAISTACAAFRTDSGQYPPDKYYPETDMNGVRPVFGAYNFRAQFQPRNISSRETLRTNDSTKPLVFFLGSRFDVMGKVYGPYMSFSLNRMLLLDPSDHVPGAATTEFGKRRTVTGIRGVGDPVSTEVYLRCLKDQFDSCYVYDCHDPEGLRIQEDALAARAHNTESFDLWSLSFDRSPFMSGGETGGAEPDRGLARTQAEEIQAARFGNDLTNWSF